MKLSSDNSQLHHYIRDVLRAPDHDLPPVDWSEVEVLLIHESKSVSLPDKKYLFLGGAAIGAIVVIFLVVKLITSSTNSSDPEVTPTEVTPLMPRTDSAKPASVLAADSAKASAPVATTIQDEIKIADSLLGEDTSASPKPYGKTDVLKKGEEQPPLAKDAKKNEKKNSKLSVLAPNISEVGAVPETIIPADSARTAPAEIKNNPAPPAAKTDTSKSIFPWKNKKSKKEKTAPPPAKPDSLK